MRENGLQLEAVDKYLRETAPDEELETALEIACRCVSLMPDERPPMNRVVQYLEPLGNFEGTISENFTPSAGTGSLRIRTLEPV